MVSDKRISELVELTSLAADDELPVVDADANATKRVTYDTLATDIRAETSTLNLGDSTAISRLAADNYRLTADATSDGLLTAWERVDEPTSTTLGASVTESGGTFNVSSAGVWLIILNVVARADDAGGDSFTSASLNINAGIVGAPGITDNGGGSSIVSYNSLFEIANLSVSDDITVNAISVTAGAIDGRTDRTETSIAFIRLGDA